jgi:hypothetical protein
MVYIEAGFDQEPAAQLIQNFDGPTDDTLESTSGIAKSER